MVLEDHKVQNLWFAIVLSLWSRQFLKVTLFEWKHCHISLFTQYLFLNEKRCHLMTFSWQFESKRTRARGKRNHKFCTFTIPGEHLLQVVCRESMNAPSKVFSTFVLGPQFGHVLCLQAKSRFPNRIRRAERLLLFTGERISLWDFN